MLRGTPKTQPGFVSGFVTAIVLFIVLRGLQIATQWLQQTSLGEISEWWTSEQTITYVPNGVFFDLLGVVIVVLILLVIIRYLAFGPRVNT